MCAGSGGPPDPPFPWRMGEGGDPLYRPHGGGAANRAQEREDNLFTRPYRQYFAQVGCRRAFY